MSHWTGEEIPDPDKYFGFCYLIIDRTDGRKYVGRKQYFVSNGTVKYRVNNKNSTRWNPKHWKNSNWRKYVGSNKELKGLIKARGKGDFTFIMLSQHISKAELHYAEACWIICTGVLGKDGFNGNLPNIKFVPPSFTDTDTYRKLGQAMLEQR
jgi:hypothetical protein